MRHALRPHPNSPCFAVTQIEVEIARPRPGSLVFSFVVTGKIDELRLPPVTLATRTDQLWLTTCLEAFLRVSTDTAYYEFNFSPSTQWAAYRFNNYRSGMQVATGLNAPRIDVQSSPERLAMQASLELDHVSGLPRDADGRLGPWRLGLSAIIEETSGRKSYWALAHPPGKADFHHSDCFAHELSRA